LRKREGGREIEGRDKGIEREGGRGTKGRDKGIERGGVSEG
jgi:hypothetical protein